MTIKICRTNKFDSNDLLVLWDGNNQQYRGISKENFVKAIRDDVAFGKPVSQYAAPLTGTTLSITEDYKDTRLILTPAGTIAALTIALPFPLDKQTLIVNSTAAITALSFTGKNGDTIVGAPTTMAVNAYFTLQYDAVLKRWYRVG